MKGIHFVACFFVLRMAGLVMGEAELIVINANVITVDEKQPRAESFAVLRGRFLGVGDVKRIEALKGANTRVVDLKGKTVVPGFNDAHLHPQAIYPADSIYASVPLGPEYVKTMDELVEALKKKAQMTPKGQWVRGARYQDTKLGRHPTRLDLDKASTEHPISISHSSGHVGVVNSVVLRNAGITKETADPAGGAFDRDGSGEPNGVLRESAKGAVRKGNPDSPDAPFQEQLAGILKCFEQFAAEGITSVGVAGGGQSNLKLFQAAREAGNRVRVSLMFSQGSFEAAKALGPKGGFGDDRLRIGGIKLFHGNSLSGRTCWLEEEYSDRPGYFGIAPARSQEALDKLVKEVHDAGFVAAIHSNGDREIAMVLAAIGRAQAANPRPDARHRIEHASVMNRRLLERAKELGVILVFHSYMWEHGDKLESFGTQRLMMMHPHRTALDMGIRLAGHSDYPVSAAKAMLRVADMVTRMGSNGKLYGPEQRVSAEEAIRVYTLGGAYTTFEEESKGSIEEGKLADFVVLEEDPTRVAAERIREIEVMSTYIGGEEIYSRDR